MMYTALTMFRALLVALCVVATPAAGQVTVHNFDGLGTAAGNQIYRWDVNGNWADFVMTGLFQAGGLFLAHGLGVACGHRVGISSPYCGERMYSSPDMVNWTQVGTQYSSPGGGPPSLFLFDPQSDGWQTNCNGGTGLGGCFMGRIAYNPTTNQFVMWYNDGTAPQYYRVLTSASAQGPYVLQTTPPANIGISNGGDEMVFVDTDNTGYLVFETTGAGPINVQKLNSTYTDGVAGTMTATGFSGDSPYMFKRGSVYHLTWSATCTLCSGAAAHQATASGPLGPWTQLADVSSTACGGQMLGVYTLQIGGTPTYLFHSEVLGQSFKATNDTAGMTLDYLEPLTFTGDTINSVSCVASFTLTGVTPGPTPPALGPPVMDQTDELAAPGFGAWCNVNNTTYYFQQFVPQKTPLANIVLPLWQTTFGCGTGCSGANGDLHVDVTAVDGSGNPATALVPTTVFHTADLTFGAVRHVIPINAAVTPGTTYGIKLSGTNTQGCYGMAPNNTAPYTAGGFKLSTNSGGTWATSGGSIKFATTTPPNLGSGAAGLRR